MDINFEIWAEKYRPHRLGDIVDQENVIKRLESFVKKKNVPHMLFAGPAGCGKTSAALAVAKDLFGISWQQNFLELNASDERGIDVIRYKVKDFARTKAFGTNYKIICLDEADALTQEAQQALRRTMEKYTGTCRFILIANYSSRIIEPIQSRCAVFRFKSLDAENVRKLLADIARKEGISADERALNAIFEISEGDMRKAVNLLQSCASEKKITEKVVYETASKAQPKEIKNILECALDGEFLKARKILLELLLKQGVSGKDIIKEVSRQIHSINLPESEKMTIIEKIGEYEFRMDQGGDEQIQLEALLAQFALKK